MPSNKITLLLTLSILVIVGGFFLINSQKPSPAERLEAEKAVYATVFSSLVNPDEVSHLNEYMLIEEYTVAGESLYNNSTELPYVFFLERGLSGLQRTTLKDLQDINQHVFPIKDYLPPTIDKSLISKNNNSSYWWKVSFSRVGFNPSLSQALVLVGDCRGDGCFSDTGEFIHGRGYFLLLGKINESWVIQNEAEIWITERPAP